MEGAHPHERGRVRPAADARRPLLLALALTAVFMVVEFAAGLWVDSLALLSDAGHMLADVGALLFAYVASLIASRPADTSRTYGYYRAEILAAFMNGLVLVALAVFIAIRAWQRIQAPVPIRGDVVLTVGLIGLGVNLGAAAVLAKGRANLNVHAALLNVMADAVGSVAAALAGLLMVWRRLYLADPIASLFVSGLILFGAWRLVRQSTHILLEGVPSRLNVPQMKSELERLPGVRAVHDLHIWSLTTGVESLSVHLCLGNGTDPHRLIRDARAVLADKYGIKHTTIQVEEPGAECPDIHP